MAPNYSHFGRAVMEALSPMERQSRLTELELQLTDILRGRTLEDYWREVQGIISALKAVGHDLWSHDYDGESASWGWDYMRPETAGWLGITFDPKRSVTTYWRPENAKFGSIADKHNAKPTADL